MSDEVRKVRSMRMQLAVMVLGIASLIAVGIRAEEVISNPQRGNEASEVAEAGNVGYGDDTGEKDEDGNQEGEGDKAEGSQGSEVPVVQPPKQPETPKETPGTPAEKPKPPVAQRPVETTGQKLVALTFDDGPSAATTPRLLDILKSRDVKVTFFVLGSMARRSPDLVRRQEAEGHEVASHTPYHHQLTKLTAAQVREEGTEMERIFTEILGHGPTLMRPPYGSVNATVQGNSAQPLILWSVDPRDWADRNAATVCSRVTSAVRNGAIILVHDIHATTVDAVPCIIDMLKSWGYEFMTVSELAAARGVTMVNGGVYYSF